MKNDSKRVLFVTNLHMWSMAANKGGRAFITTVESYINAGWSVFIVSTGGGIPDHVKAEAKCYEDSFPQIDSLSNSRFGVVRYSFKRLRSFLCQRFYIKTIKQLYNNGIFLRGIIYGYEVEAVKAAAKLAKKYKMPLVTRFQGTIIANIDDTFVNRLRYYPHFDALATPADLIIMTNDGTQGLKTLKRLGNNSPTKFWMNGVSIPSLVTPEQRNEVRKKCGFEDKYVFLTVSRLVGWKRVDRAITAFSKIKDEIPNSYLHIIGDGAARASLEEVARTNGVENNVVFHGAIEQTKVFDYMVASDVFVSLYDLSNVGNPLLEAMSCGKPIITLDNGDTAMFIHNMENGIILSINDIPLVQEMMLLLYKNGELASKLGRSARQYAEDNFWSWKERMNQELIEVGKQLS